MANNGGNPAGRRQRLRFGPLYQAGHRRCRANPASVLCRPATRFRRAAPGMPAAPPQLCGGRRFSAGWATTLFLPATSSIGIDDMMARAKGRIPPDKVAEQRAMLVQEVTAGIDEFNAHYLDPDPAKAMSLSQRGLINQLLRQQIDVKMIYQDFLKTVPKEALAVDPRERQSPLRREPAQDPHEAGERGFPGRSGECPACQGKLLGSRKADLHGASRGPTVGPAEGETGRRKGEGREEEVTHEEMLAWYQAHLKDFEQPAKARWEELMVSFARHPNRDEAYAAVAALGNRVLAGASLADVAKSASEGPTARQGGQRDWTHKGSLSSETLNQAIFSLPVGQLSPKILESQDGFHIIRVVERQELTQDELPGRSKGDQGEHQKGALREALSGVRRRNSTRSIPSGRSSTTPCKSRRTRTTRTGTRRSKQLRRNNVANSLLGGLLSAGWKPCTQKLPPPCRGRSGPQRNWR